MGSWGLGFLWAPAHQGLPVGSLWGLPEGLYAQTFQNPLIKEYTLNYGRIPNMM